MRLKSYFAASVESAMSLARNELGSEALLVQSRKAPPEARHLGDYEVVFASIPESGASAQARREAKAVPERAASNQGNLGLEIASLKTQLSALRRDLRSAPGHGTWLPADSQFSDLYSALLAADVEPPLVHRLLKATQLRLAAETQPGPAGDMPFFDTPETASFLFRRPLPRLDRDRLWKVLSAELENAFSVDSTVSSGGDGPAVIALVGPPGAGKTTTIAKLAVNIGLKMRRRTQLFSLDNYRIAASQRLMSYAAIIGLGCEVLESTGALAQALEENHNKSLILIDTPGYGPGELRDAPDLAQFLARRSDIETHLVLPASMKTSDMNRIADSFDIFGVSRLLFTKLDETETFGPILSLSARTGLPLSFLGRGQRVPEDFESATKSHLSSLVLSEEIEKPELSVA